MSLPVIIQGLAAIASLGLLLLAVAKRNVPKSLYFTYLALALCCYTLGIFFELISPSFEAALLAARFQYLGIPFIAPLYYLFMRDYYTQLPQSKGAIAALLAVPVVFSALMNSYPYTHLFYRQLGFVAVPHGRLLVTPGPAYYVFTAYVFLFIGLGSYTALRAFIKTPKHQRMHMNLFPVAVLLPLAAALLYLSGVLPDTAFDPTSAALTVTMLVFAVYTLRYRAIDWMPLARENILEHLREAYILLDTEDRYLDANATALRYIPALREAKSGTPAAEIAGFPIELLAHSAESLEFTVEQGEDEESALHLRASTTPITARGQLVCNAIFIYDVTELHHMMEELHELATHDTLTGLYNRGTFYNFASRDFELAIRNSDAASVLMLDIDFFKLVNDRYGHQTGDEVLVAIAEILVGRLRRTDIIGRYGGEEILVFLPGASREGAGMIAEVIRRTIEQRQFSFNGKPFHITVSIGVATINPEQHATIEDLVLAADTAMYKAKTTGRNKVVAAEAPTKQKA